MNYGWNLINASSFGRLSRELLYANMLIDEILAGNLKEVKWFLEVKKANPNTVVPERGVAALHLLAGLENEDFSEQVMLLVLSHHGGDANVRSEEGLTPVHVAAMWGRCRVLRRLLGNGGNPDLTDYVMFLDAEEFALRELQWEAYRLLAAYPRDVEFEENSFQHEVCSESNSFTTENNESLTISTDMGDVVSEDCDLLMGPTALNENAVGAIRNHRRKTKTYGEYATETAVNSRSSSRPTSNIRPSSKREGKLLESETYVCSFSESSLKRPTSSTSFKSSAPRNSLVDRMKNPNNQILCKMSRIFLFMLKRKHVHERLNINYNSKY